MYLQENEGIDLVPFSCLMNRWHRGQLLQSGGMGQATGRD